MKYLKKFNEGSAYRIDLENYGSIISIDEISDYQDPILDSICTGGYKIITDKFEIYILIGNEQNCCEVFGYISSDDEFSDYIGETITGIIKTDDELNQKVIDKLDLIGGSEETNTFFINVETTKGPIQFALYNSHNGYYGHNCFLFIKNTIDNSRNIIKSEVL